MMNFSDIDFNYLDYSSNDKMVSGVTEIVSIPLDIRKL